MWRQSASSAANYKEIKIIVMLSTISLLFIACTTPLCAFNTAAGIVRSLAIGQPLYYISFLYYSFALVLDMVNNSVSIFIYYKMSTKYRKEFHIMMSSWRRKPLRMGGLVSSVKNINTITDRLKYYAETDPDKELYVFYNCDTRVPYTSTDLYTLAGRFARRLRQNGFQKGDVIANTLPNSPERLITDLGIVMAGCIAMNGQVFLADGSDFFHSARTSRCRAVIVPDAGPALRLLKPFQTNSADDGLPTPLCIPSAPDLTSLISVARNSPGQRKPFLVDLRAGTEEVFLSPSDPDDVIIVLTTSGTTGYCKLVPRSHKEIIQICEFHSSFTSPGVEWEYPNSKNFVYYSDRLLGWSGGMFFYSICNADTRVMLDVYSPSNYRDTVRELWDVVGSERCDTVVFLPLEFENVYESLKSSGGPLRKLKLIITAGQPFRERQVNNFFNVSENVAIHYGSTEVSNIAAIHPKVGSYESNNCGQLIEGMEVKIVNDNGEQCRTNESGTILAKGRYAFKGYFNQLEILDPQTKKAFTPDGWFDMGDYGYLDDKGDLFVFGRGKDVITYGAFVFYPGWMEKKLAEHPDVVEAFVVPVSDPVLYQNICACVKVTADSDLDEHRLKEYCDDIFLPGVSSAITPKPKYFIIMKEDFPMTSTGKPDKQTLRRMAEDMFGDSHQSRENC
ncbi:hypothetical protein Btru_070551 [Bulinus truncatus]|nr:hypothetical protein Btru_070551 [Bulinus truncatus]